MTNELHFRRAVVAASALHAILLFFFAQTGLHKQLANRSAKSNNETDRELIVTLETQQKSGRNVDAQSGALRDRNYNSPNRPALGSAERLTSYDRSNRSSVTSTDATASDTHAAEGVPASAPDSTALPGATGQRGLSLDQLSLSGNRTLAYALSREESPSNPLQSANDRLQRSMQQEAVDNNRKLGLGVPAPLIIAMEAAAREAAIPTNSTALFTANIDGSGKLLGIDLVATNHASPAWAKLSERVEAALSGHKLSILSNRRGVEFKLRLVARSELPSGRDPGLQLDVLGLPAKKGRGKRSSSISLLDPRPVFLEYEIPGENGNESVKIPVPRLVFNVLTVNADPADIGTPARATVRVHVVDEKVY